MSTSKLFASILAKYFESKVVILRKLTFLFTSKIKTYVHKNPAYKCFQLKFIDNHPKLETIQIPFN